MKLEEEDEGASGGESRALQHLDAVVEAVADKDAARAVDCDAVETVELAGGAAWPADSFAQMRAQLHPKICATLFGSSI